MCGPLYALLVPVLLYFALKAEGAETKIAEKIEENSKDPLDADARPAARALITECVQP